MRVQAKITTKCSECNEYIVAQRDYIRKLYDGGTVWVHDSCYVKYWDRFVGQTTLGDKNDMDE